MLSQLSTFDKLYINSASTRLLQMYKNDFIEYKNKTFPNNSQIHFRACDAVSSYHCLYPSTVLEIPKWDCIFNFCCYCPSINAPYLESSEELNHISLLPLK